MPKRFIVAGAVAIALTSAASAQTLEKKNYNYSEWTKGRFSEAVTVTGPGGKIIFLAGVGAEDENGPRGAIRHKGDFLAQCAYAYDKIKRALSANGSSLKDAVKMTVYVTDMRNRLDWAKCSGEAFAGATVPARAPASMDMLQIVSRPSMPSALIVEPAYSMTWPTPPAVPILAMMARITSLA